MNFRLPIESGTLLQLFHNLSLIISTSHRPKSTSQEHHKKENRKGFVLFVEKGVSGICLNLFHR